MRSRFFGGWSNQDFSDALGGLSKLTDDLVWRDKRDSSGNAQLEVAAYVNP